MFFWLLVAFIIWLLASDKYKDWLNLLQPSQTAASNQANTTNTNTPSSVTPTADSKVVPSDFGNVISGLTGNAGSTTGSANRLLVTIPSSNSPYADDGSE